VHVGGALRLGVRQADEQVVAEPGGTITCSRMKVR